VLAAAYGVLVIGQDAASRIRMARVTAAIRADGLPLTRAEFVEACALSPQQAGAVTNLLSALAALPAITNRDWRERLGSRLPVEGHARLPDPNIALPSEMVAAMEERLSQVATNLEAVRSTIPDTVGLEIGMTLPDSDHTSRLGLLRQGARLLKMRAVLDADRNDPDRAMASVEDGLRLAGVPSRAPSTIEKLVGIACADLAVCTLETVLARTDPAPARLAAMNAALERLDAADGPPAAEIPMTAMAYDRLLARGCEDDLLGLFHSEDRRRWHVLLTRGPAMRGWLRMNRAWNLAVVHNVVRNWSLPWPSFQARTEEVGRGVPSICFLARTGADTFPSVRARQLRARGYRQCARLALAIEAYAVAGGRLPESLADLCPKYIREPGSDPFGGQPFRYTLEDGSGAIAFADPSTGRDVVFRVYPAAGRPTP
jgi:hypothetical protein